jgi:hypothetical protein
MKEECEMEFNRKRKISNLVKQCQEMRKNSVKEIKTWESTVFVNLIPAQQPTEDSPNARKVGRPKKRLSDTDLHEKTKKKDSRRHPEQPSVYCRRTNDYYCFPSTCIA